jgi:hypothetical protein
MLYLKGLDKVISHSIVHPTWQYSKPELEGDKHAGWVYRTPGDAPLSNLLGLSLSLSFLRCNLTLSPSFPPESTC